MIRVTSNLPVLYAKGVDQSPLKNCGHCIRHVFLALLVAFWTLPIQFVVLSRQLLWQVDDSWTFGLQETCAETLLVLPQIFSVGLLVATKTTTGVTMSACHETKKQITYKKLVVVDVTPIFNIACALSSTFGDAEIHREERCCSCAASVSNIFIR